MSSSFAVTESTSFTVTHARHMAAKVAADLKRIQRLYGEPSDDDIQSYETEIVELLKAGYLGEVTLGYKRAGQWIEPTLRYTAKNLAGGSAADEDPGKIRPSANIAGASFYNYLTYNAAWNNLTPQEKEAFKNRMPFKRTGAPEPGVAGYLVDDRTYSSGGRALSRSSVKGF